MRRSGERKADRRERTPGRRTGAHPRGHVGAHHYFKSVDARGTCAPCEDAVEKARDLETAVEIEKTLPAEC